MKMILDTFVKAIYPMYWVSKEKWQTQTSIQQESYSPMEGTLGGNFTVHAWQVGPWQDVFSYSQDAKWGNELKLQPKGFGLNKKNFLSVSFLIQDCLWVETDGKVLQTEEESQ